MKLLTELVYGNLKGIWKQGEHKNQRKFFSFIRALADPIVLKGARPPISLENNITPIDIGLVGMLYWGPLK